MFIVYKIKNYDGELVYKKESIIGVYSDFRLAKIHLIKKLIQLKYEFEIETDNEDYFLACVERNNEVLCFEISSKKLNINEIKLKS